MKTKILTLLICCSSILFMGNTAQAETNSVEPENIQEYISYPEAARSDNLDDKVFVSFKVDTSGKVEIQSVESEYEIFSNSVKEQLSNLILEKLDTSKIYRLIFHFNLL